MTRSHGQLVRQLIGSVGIAAFGSGVVFSFTAIYLTRQPAFGSSAAATYYAVLAMTNVAAALAVASGLLRAEARVLGTAGACAAAVGSLGVVVAHSFPGLVAAAATIGVGQGLFGAALVPMLSSLITPSERRVTFARYYRAMNLGLGLGAVAGGLTTSMVGLSSVRYLFLLNALSYIPIAVLALRVPPRALQQAEVDPTAASAAPMRYGALGFVGAIGAPVALEFFAYFGAFSQFETTVPLASQELMGIGLFSASLLVAINTVSVVVLQNPITRWVERYVETSTLAISMVIWFSGYVLLAACSLGDRTLGVVALAALGVLFAVGECAYACSFSPWLIRRVRGEDLVRASAVCSVVMGLGTASGPAFGVLLIAQTGSAVSVWTTLAGCCLVVFVFACLVGVRDPAARRTRVMGPSVCVEQGEGQ